MPRSLIPGPSLRSALVAIALIAISGCSSKETLPPAGVLSDSVPPLYRVGPLDSLNIFVWRNPEMSASTVVRPDGRLTVPLIEELYVTGLTPSEVARKIEEELAQFVQDPLVTIMVGGFNGTFDQQIRILGAAANPRALPYVANMTALDLMISTGGLTDFADGNATTLVRVVDGEQKEYRVRLDDLVRDGDIGANVTILPGDILIVPETFF